MSLLRNVWALFSKYESRSGSEVGASRFVLEVAVSPWYIFSGGSGGGGGSGSSAFFENADSFMVVVLLRVGDRDSLRGDAMESPRRGSEVDILLAFLMRPTL